VNGKLPMTGERPAVADRFVQADVEDLRFPIGLQSRRIGLLKQLDRPWPKRLFDICFASTVLLTCLPLYTILALSIAATSDGPVFYSQERVGRNGRRFNCIKFRTMVVDADAVLANLMATSPDLREEYSDTFKLKQDPRITRIGKFLRVTSLDEFPQFWNVLKGDMSVVGPRPLVEEELPRYGTAIYGVLRVRPGITGLWQVSGRNDIPYDDRIQIDLWYSRYRTFFLDLWIIVRTLGVVLFPKNNGAY
jgi:lipopolysaccharide/colanic/teichoic acid biosynthesis glycosyltransferase